ncbi:pilus assembly protein [Sphingomonas sp. FARSPH]|uniref:pilus assembly protein n=2 Tax=Sphingomonas TaxID=13687 RepID=UPI001E5FFA2F|nr:pilus assembly protein [Sphingomonas sp. FARSPH]
MFSFGIISYSWWYFLANGVQRAASDGARAAIAGLDAGERQSLATTKATDNLRAVGSYNMQQAQVAVVEQSNRLTVTVTYDTAGLSIVRLPFVPAPPQRIVQRASILLGGM